MADLGELPNLGSHSVEQLKAVGIETAEDLVTLGAEQAWLKVQVIDPGVCLHMLYGLEGAVQGIPKAQIDVARKQQLKAFMQSNQSVKERVSSV